MNPFQFRSPSMARLLVISGNATTQVVTIPLPCLIGRGQETDLNIDHLTVSRNHCKLDLHDGKVFITDLGSRNGTQVEHQPIPQNTPVELENSQTFSIGPLTFELEIQLTEVPRPNAKYAATEKPILSST